MVEKDAKALYKAGERRLGTDEKVFIEIFSERSSAHLAAVSSAYNSMYGNSLKKVAFFQLMKNPFLHLFWHFMSSNLIEIQLTGYKR